MTLLLLFLVSFFFSSETFILYIMFELSVIPIFVIIILESLARKGLKLIMT